ncbi:hypothetical protein KCU88_g337, partial [Aureobasidium melanogenum]
MASSADDRASTPRSGPGLNAPEVFGQRENTFHGHGDDEADGAALKVELADMVDSMPGTAIANSIVMLEKANTALQFSGPCAGRKLQGALNSSMTSKSHRYGLRDVTNSRHRVGVAAAAAPFAVPALFSKSSCVASLHALDHTHTAAVCHGGVKMQQFEVKKVLSLVLAATGGRINNIWGVNDIGSRSVASTQRGVMIVDWIAAYGGLFVALKGSRRDEERLLRPFAIPEQVTSVRDSEEGLKQRAKRYRYCPGRLECSLQYQFSLPAAAFQVLTVCLSFHALQRIYPSTILPTFNSSTTSATSSATKQLLQGWGASIDIVDYVFEKEDCIYVCQFTVLVL